MNTENIDLPALVSLSTHPILNQEIINFLFKNNIFENPNNYKLHYNNYFQYYSIINIITGEIIYFENNSNKHLTSVWVKVE